MKKNILHIIDSLDIGGAEAIVTGIANSMREHNHIVVTLLPVNKHQDKLKFNEVLYLNYSNKLSLFRCIYILRKIIRRKKIQIIHSHLLTATFLARLAKPKNVALFFTVHNILSESAFKISKVSKLLEIITYKKTHIALFVSESVKTDYEKNVGIKGKSYVLYNFIDSSFFNLSPPLNISLPIKLIAVGSLKSQKNYPFLIKTISTFERKNFLLDIYGEGSLRKVLEQQIRSHKLDNYVKLKGNNFHLSTIFPQYHIFIMTSIYEGFGLALLEAMAVGLPCIVSDIPAFKEVGGDTCLYFDLTKEDSLKKLLMKVLNHELDLKELTAKSKARAKYFSKENHINKLVEIYERN